LPPGDIKLCKWHEEAIEGFLCSGLTLKSGWKNERRGKMEMVWLRHRGYYLRESGYGSCL